MDCITCTELAVDAQKASRSTFGFPSFAKLGGGGSQASDSPDLVRERVLGRGTGNWLSHFDFEGRRCARCCVKQLGSSALSPVHCLRRPTSGSRTRAGLQALQQYCACWQVCWQQPDVLCAPRMWTLANESPVRWQPIDYPLPSDCSRRQDLLALAHGADMKQAQHTKELMENLQRSDAKMRKAALAQ